MDVYIPARHGLHRPRWDYSDGLPPFEHLERPERVDGVLEGFARVCQLDVAHVAENDLDAVRRLHDADYVDWLLAMGERLQGEAAYIPALFRANPAKAPLEVRGGAYCREIGSPIGADTVDAALNAAATAKQGAERLATTGDVVAALCRPPGHHAGRRRYGGYCYFNNAYVAAHTLGDYGRCVVLDVDYHLGDGSMELASPQTPYFSLHADPWRSYPYLSLDEGEAGPGVHLYTVPAEADGRAYLALLDGVIDAIRAEAAEYLVLSLGFDTLGSDYIQDQPIGLQAGDFREIGRRVADIGLHTLILLEGGYDAANLPDCAAAFLDGFTGVRTSTSE